MNTFFGELPLEQLHNSGGKYKVRAGSVLAKVIKPLHGLWRFCLATNKGRRYFDLRLDAETALASGDVFRDADRKDWEQSFRLTTAYLCNTGSARFLVLNCDAVLDERLPRSRVIARLVTRLLINEGEIEAVEARATSCGNTWRTDWSGVLQPTRSAGEWPFTFSPGLFRQIRINYYFDAAFDAAFDAQDRERAEHALAKLVPEHLAREGFALRTTALELPRGGTQYADIPGPLADTQSTTDPWTFSLVFSGVDETLQRKDRGGGASVPFGRAIGLNAAAPRYRSRFGAIIYAGELQRNFRETEAETGAISSDNRDFRMVFTIMHELGHLLNLPHPWERDLAIRDIDAPDPAALTWMAYGSYYPFGAIAAQAYQGDDTRATRLQRRRGHQQFLKIFEQDPRYSPAERDHLRHAAFDCIAVGKRAFSDPLKAPPNIGEESTYGPYELLLNVDAAPDAPLLYSVSAGAGYAHEPPSGTLKLKVKGRHDDPLQFEFHTGALQLVARCEPSKYDTANLPPPRRIVRVYNPVVNPDNGLDWREDYADFLGPRPEPNSYILTIPLIPPVFWSRFDRQLAFKLQAVYYAADGSAVRSKVVDLAFKPVHPDTDLSQLRSQVAALKSRGLAAWRDKWVAQSVGLNAAIGAGPLTSSAPLVNGLERWSYKLGGDPQNLA